MVNKMLGLYNFLKLIVLILLMPYGMMAYPVFGTKRYGRASTPVHNGWSMSSLMHVPAYYYQTVSRQSHYPINYYKAMSPYASDYTDDYYYPQEALNYPIYYPTVARNSKYDLYQPAIPYYYSDRYLTRPDYGYYEGAESVDDLQEEMLQEEEREEREEALPIGQETWYETDNTPGTDESMDDVNAAFLQNLMMYNNAFANQNYDYEKQPVDAYSQQGKDYSEDFVNWNLENNHNKNYGTEDEDVKELKMLAEKPKKQKNNKNNKKHNAAQERLQIFGKGNKNQKVPNYDPNNSEAWINWDNKRAHINKHNIEPIVDFAFKKPEQKQQYEGDKNQKINTQTSTIKIGTSTPLSIIGDAMSNEKPARDARGGQKEVVLMRPATPVRRPFSEPVMELLAQQGGPERKRSPSVYDTIKHLLEMEKNLEEDYLEHEILRPPMRKRYVSNEESLVAELSGLKKTA